MGGVYGSQAVGPSAPLYDPPLDEELEPSLFDPPLDEEPSDMSPLPSDPVPLSSDADPLSCGPNGFTTVPPESGAPPPVVTTISKMAPASLCVLASGTGVAVEPPPHPELMPGARATNAPTIMKKGRGPFSKGAGMALLPYATAHPSTRARPGANLTSPGAPRCDKFPASLSLGRVAY